MARDENACSSPYASQVYLVLAVVSAVFYGAGDFLGGLTSKRADTVAVVVLSQFSGLVLLTVMLVFAPAANYTTHDLLWGAAAGITGGSGVAILYHALATGTMAVVAPITAVCAVVIPVGVAIALGERPNVFTLAGIALAVIAIVLLSRSESTGERHHYARSIALALAAGIVIGLFFLCLARTGRDAGLWPLLVARLVSVPLFGAIAIVGRRSLVVAPRLALLIACCGALDMLANLLYQLAAHLGPLSVVVTLASLYPASTVVLARVTLGERLTSSQAIGVACAMVAVVVIVGSTNSIVDFGDY
jgi:drug/metabolite transporter (DMT)-like permease